MNTLSGKFIVFEGIDGAGKTTQIKIVENFLNSTYDVISTSEPTTVSEYGKRLHESFHTTRLPAEEELECFMKDREHHVQAFIRPALEQGTTILCDRYWFSTYAYQNAYKADGSVRFHDHRSVLIKPNLVLYFAIDPVIALARKEKKSTFEENDKYMQQVAENYELLYQSNVVNMVKVDATKSVEEVTKACLAAITPILVRK